MGGLGRRLERLEEASRGSAAARVRSAWGSLTDGEIAAPLAPYAGAEELPDGTVRLSREPTPEGRAAEEKLKGAVPEGVLARAIGYSGSTTPEEAGRRLGALVGPAMPRGGRGSAARRRRGATRGGHEEQAAAAPAGDRGGGLRRALPRVRRGVPGRRRRGAGPRLVADWQDGAGHERGPDPSVDAIRAHPHEALRREVLQDIPASRRA
jgi:hypothetical protein